VKVIKPTHSHIDSYLQALRRGWSETIGEIGADKAEKRAAEINQDRDEFLELFDDLDAKASPYLLPDQTVAYAIPSVRRWIWDNQSDQFCGTLSLRWQTGTTDLPYHLMGHIGYTVPPWMQGKGFASFGLKAMIEIAKTKSLPFVYLVTDLDNLASQRVIIKNSGQIIGPFTKPAMYGSQAALRFKIQCT